MNQMFFGQLPAPAQTWMLTDECELALWENVEPVEVTRYFELLDRLEQASEYARHSIGTCLYRTYRLQEGGILNVAYTAGDCSLRVVLDPLAGAGKWVLPPQSCVGRKKLCQPTLFVLPLDYSHRDVTDGNGMAFVILLEDGSYLIYDGGYPEDAERLFCLLWEHSPLPNHRIVISAWILTHSHGDHYGCFCNFSRMFTGRVHVRYFLLNSLPNREDVINPIAYDGFLTTDFHRYAAAYEGAAKIRMHTGQRIFLPGVELEVLQTFEDVLPLPLKFLNEASIVTRLRMEGQSLLFFADCERQAEGRIALFGEALKSDFMQVMHHAFSGGTPEIFHAVDPSYCLWTTNFESYAFRTLPAWRNGLYANLLTEQKVVRSFVADGAVKAIPLPLEDVKSVRYLTYTPMCEIENHLSFDPQQNQICLE